jgi:hypothetical protein
MSEFGYLLTTTLNLCLEVKFEANVLCLFWLLLPFSKYWRFGQPEWPRKQLQSPVRTTGIKKRSSRILGHSDSSWSGLLPLRCLQQGMEHVFLCLVQAPGKQLSSPHPVQPRRRHWGAAPCLNSSRWTYHGPIHSCVSDEPERLGNCIPIWTGPDVLPGACWIPSQAQEVLSYGQRAPS